MYFHLNMPTSSKQLYLSCVEKLEIIFYVVIFDNVLNGPCFFYLGRIVGSDVCRDPVERWLQETRSRVDAECMTTLQGKAIASRLGSACSRVVGARDAVRALQQRAHVISAEFAKLCQ